MSVAIKTGESYDELIKTVSEIVAKISGNVLEEKQALMVQTRVKKRMLELNIQTPGEYLSYLKQNQKEESDVLVSLLTTHHTFFFREFNHFEFIEKNLTQIVADVKASGRNTIEVWSAACSRGQEVYSLAMFLDFYLPKIDPSMKYKITGSDIDPESVKIAKNGVYHRREIKSAPMHYLADHWVRGTGDISDYVKAKKSLTANVEFAPANLLELKNFAVGRKFDIIFCRNVFIYFRPHQIKDIMHDFLGHLHDKGYFFSGISESLGGLDLKIETVGPSVYRLPQPEVVVEDVADTPVATPAPVVASKLPTMPDVLKVLCVDDSSSILTLLKKIFGADDSFEVVGVAKNGVEAEQMVKELKPDIMTLDIHMPEMDGVTYLEKNYRKGHPPVVMISSASRDDSDAAMRALRAGASDFIEKPALSNIMERGEEIKTKVKVAFLDKLFDTSSVSSIDKEFEHKMVISDADSKFRVIYSSITDQKKIEYFFKEVQGDQPPTVMFFEGQDNILAAMKEEMNGKFSCSVELLDDKPTEFKKNTIYLADFKKLYEDICTDNKGSKTSFLVYGKASKHAQEKILEWDNAHLLVEDLNYKCELTEIATDVVPATSFAYMSCEFLSKD